MTPESASISASATTSGTTPTPCQLWALTTHTHTGLCSKTVYIVHAATLGFRLMPYNGRLGGGRSFKGIANISFSYEAESCTWRRRLSLVSGTFLSDMEVHVTHILITDLLLVPLWLSHCDNGSSEVMWPLSDWDGRCTFGWIPASRHLPLKRKQLSDVSPRRLEASGGHVRILLGCFLLSFFIFCSPVSHRPQ